MKEFIDDNFHFWMGTVKNSEGFNVGNLLQASTFPYLAVIATYGSNLTIVDTRGGPISAEDLMAWLTTVLDQHGAELVADRFEA